jgi:hypothetical protein
VNRHEENPLTATMGTMVDVHSSFPGASNQTDKFVGTWRLVSATSTTKNGEPGDPPYGEGPTGLLTYTGDGRMSSLISYGGRKPLSIGRGGMEAQEEQAQAFKTFLAYAGRYTASGGNVTHHVEIASIQNYVGRDLVRQARLQDDQLILVAPPTLVNGKIQTVELIWQRLARDAGPIV